MFEPLVTNFIIIFMLFLSFDKKICEILKSSKTKFGRNQIQNHHTVLGWVLVTSGIHCNLTVIETSCTSHDSLLVSFHHSKNQASLCPKATTTSLLVLDLPDAFSPTNQWINVCMYVCSSPGSRWLGLESTDSHSSGCLLSRT